MKRALRLLRRYAQLFLVVLAQATILTFFGRAHWLIELVTHFEIQYLIAALVLTPFAMLPPNPDVENDPKPRNAQEARLAALIDERFGRWKPNPYAILGFVLILAHGSRIVPWYMPAEANENEATVLRLLTANVHTDNTRYDDLVALIRQTNPDLVLLQEVDQKWIDGLAEIEADYPYRVTRPRNDNFGIVTYSRIPFVDMEINDLAEIGIPGVHAVVDVGGKRVSVLNYHTLPPVTREFSAWRNKQLRVLHHYPDRQEGPTIIAGDFNVTMWSPHYRDLARESGLVNARRGRGVKPTWLVSFRTLFGLPLDHVLVSPEIEVERMAVLRNFGSDHRAVLVELGV